MSHDELTRKLTAYNNFERLVEAGKGGYSPSLTTRRGALAMMLADAFDSAMRAAGSDVRAWRGLGW